MCLRLIKLTPAYTYLSILSIISRMVFPPYLTILLIRDFRADENKQEKGECVCIRKLDYNVILEMKVGDKVNAIIVWSDKLSARFSFRGTGSFQQCPP